ncbi:hypothetical protein B0H10DRAFT_2229530 [Mycena sp. CBHHK59/15]|nr:hypothetical protein B0H10DRAFT_2229530 [Mycena sp. CBHHK59/15]
MDGDHFDYEKFFWTIDDLFDNQEWGQEIVGLWNKVILCTVAGSKPTADASMSGPSHLEQLKAALTTKKCSAAAAPAATTSV